MREDGTDNKGFENAVTGSHHMAATAIPSLTIVRHRFRVKLFPVSLFMFLLGVSIVCLISYTSTELFYSLQKINDQAAGNV